MTDEEIWNHFLEVLTSDVPSAAPHLEAGPHLAHYTSLQALELILRSNEIWLSNPLLMNDVEEERFGIIEGSSALKRNSAIREALGSEERLAEFVSSIDDAIDRFDQQHLLDTYIFCLSRHETDDMDGLLSMWRGYGGRGKGAAIVFDTGKLASVQESPLVVAPVNYDTRERRLAWFGELGDRYAKTLTDAAPENNQIHLTAAALFERLKLFALFTKHRGFEEEREWRVVYFRDRDGDDKLKDMFHYVNGPRGIEPKLRLKVEPMAGVMPENVSFEQLIDRIILGPSLSTPLARRSVERMLDVIKRPALKDRLVASSIPFRSQ